MSPSRAANAQFTEDEAAAMLGVSIPAFRSLVSSHILNGEATDTDGTMVTYSRSDLLVLRFLVSQGTGAA